MTSTPFKKILVVVFVFFLIASSQAIAQDSSSAKASSPNDTIYATTQPVRGFKPFVYELEKVLSQADTVGKRHRMRLNNIGFIVSKAGSIDSAWVIFRPRPIHNEIIKFLKTQRWIPARQDGQSIASVQEPDIEIYLTKAAFKRHRSWKSLTERILAPWSH